MVIKTTFIIVIVLVLLIWMFIEFKRFRHKAWAIFLIALILFSYFSFTAAIKGKDINFKSVDGVKQAGKLYVLWLGHVFQNVKMITTNAIHMDWKGNETNGSISKVKN